MALTLEQKQRYAEQKRAYNAAIVAAGLCLQCHQPNDRPERRMCSGCSVRQVRLKAIRRGSKQKPERERLADADVIGEAPVGHLPCVRVGCVRVVKVGPVQLARAMRLGCPWAMCRRCAKRIRRIKGDE